MLPLNFFEKFSVLRVLGFKKASKFDFFRNELHAVFFPILIPSTQYVKFSLFFFLVVGGSQKSKSILFRDLKLFQLGLEKDFFD